MASTDLIRNSNIPIKMDIITVPQADVDTDASGDIVITFPNLREVLFAQLQIGAGYVANQISKSGNTATFRVFWTGAVVDTALAAADSESNIADSTAIAFGY